MVILTIFVLNQINSIMIALLKRVHGHLVVIFKGTVFSINLNPKSTLISKSPDVPARHFYKIAVDVGHTTSRLQLNIIKNNNNHRYDSKTGVIKFDLPGTQ